MLILSHYSLPEQARAITAILLSIFIIICINLPAQASPIILFNGRILTCNEPPIIENGTTLVSLRAIFEAIGATVSWDEDSQTVTASKANNLIKIQIGSSTAIKNSVPVHLDVPGKVINGTTMVPVRFISESMGYTTYWLEEFQAVYITDSIISSLLKFEGRIVPAGSMLPTININDRVLVNKLAYMSKSPQRGDLIIFDPPEYLGLKDLFLKRVIGLPGETVQVKNGQVFINGNMLDEPYILEPMEYEYGPVVVPANSLFVLGDNRNNSYDSHMWNDWLTIDRIKGKVECIYWPTDHQKNL